MISFVLFPQALQPSMSFNISGYWSVELINVADGPVKPGIYSVPFSL